MRIARLDLIRYGKFSQRALALPGATCDFHVIVGPNEAGKSTVRAAVQDLLYGIPRQSPQAFLHGADTRLGALLAHAGRTIEFQRSKALRQTLRDAQDAALPDDALAPFVGATDKAFFEQMFGLDHGRLVAGGHSILSAAHSDVGQVLFQSATGIASLGAVRQRLEDEAASLWTPRRAKDRAFYVAADALEQADKALKAATVRTRDWTLASTHLAALQAEDAQAQHAHAQLRNRRNLLERVRRTAPPLQALDQAQAALATMPDVAALPEGAAAQLNAWSQQEALAQAELAQHSATLAQAEAALTACAVEPQLLALAPEIEELNARRLQYRAHASDLQKREAEQQAQQALAQDMARQLGWDVPDATALAARLPGPALRGSLGALLRRHQATQDALEAARRALADKEAELRLVAHQLAGLGADALPAALQDALVQAKRLGDSEQTAQQLRQAAAQQTLALQQAERALQLPGSPVPDLQALRAMREPAPAQRAAWLQAELADAARVQAAQARLAELAQRQAEAALDLTQFQASHQAVTRAQVLQARGARQAAWDTIAAEPSSLSRHAADYQVLVGAADALADTQQEHVQQASSLQARQHAQERLHLDAQLQAQALQALQQGAQARAQAWAASLQACGLPDLALADAGDWLDARRRVLSANDALDAAREQVARHDAVCAQLQALLARELGALGHVDQATADASLRLLLTWAEAAASAAAEARGQRKTLQQQQDDGQGALAGLRPAWEQARDRAAEWQATWNAALARSGLGTQTAGGELRDEVGAVEAALQQVERIAQALEQAQQIQVQRIAPMRADLAQFAASAQALAEQAAPALAGQPAEAIALELTTRLAAARNAAQESDRQRALQQQASAQAQAASLRWQQAQAGLAALFALAGVADKAGLTQAIARSDQHRQLRAEDSAARHAVLAGGDGLTLDALRAESATLDTAGLLAELEELAGQDQAQVERRTRLAAQMQAAQVALDAIGGSADAAVAEGQRQQALASMGDAVERYLKVQTAARMLQWAIEQYREARQGPLLAKASGIFASLTLGGFERLSVNFDADPPTLQGRRPDGTLVPVEGLSEGTRDQLYLALRLAALAMHLGQAHALPFIADDLFINYDDQRASAGLRALQALSRQTQVLFLTHHDHLLPAIRAVFGDAVNVLAL